MKIKDIGFISTRLSGIDGVSLEAKKWADVLERNDYACYFMAGKLDYPTNKSLIIPEAHFKNPTIQKIQNACFNKKRRSNHINHLIQSTKDTLKQTLYQFQKQFSLDLIIVENALAIPMNIPLGLALAEFIKETNMPTIAHHHDFYWERDRFLANNIETYLDSCFPPRLSNIKHVTINSMASKDLQARRKIKNTIIPNVLDFAYPPQQTNTYAHDLRKKIGLRKHNLFVLQPTRVIQRKNIEQAIELVTHLDMEHPTLAISHAAGDEKTNYEKILKKYAKSLKIKLINIYHLVDLKRGKDKKGNKIYSLTDVYSQADLITYPSVYEGFGNTFLEAIYFKKPIVLNRYPVYIVDIEPKGFEVISSESFVSDKTVNEIKQLLANSEKLKAMTDKNYAIAQKYFSYEVLEKKLLKLIHLFE
ncbi:glycosyltransferase family 4 protein [Patescibacteria group bacterium AH-259-L05]|nr:glycosyltransferase family 4 protein [Patescibacteria group bacterium AH-259-L05]